MMVHGVTYVELYLRRLEVLRALYSQRADHVGIHNAGTSGDRPAAPRAAWSPAHRTPETTTTQSSSVHAHVTGVVANLDNSGLISAHVPDRGSNGTEDGPYLVGYRKHGDSAIPPSPSAVKRRHMRGLLDFISTTRSKIPRQSLPYTASAIRSHPLAFGVIKSCQAEAGTVHQKNGKAGRTLNSRDRQSQQDSACGVHCQRVVMSAQTSATGMEGRHPEPESSVPHSLSLNGDFLRPPPSMYCTLTSEDMLLQHMQVRSDRGGLH